MFPSYHIGAWLPIPVPPTLPTFFFPDEIMDMETGPTRQDSHLHLSTHVTIPSKGLSVLGPSSVPLPVLRVPMTSPTLASCHPRLPRLPGTHKFV